MTRDYQIGGDPGVSAHIIRGDARRLPLEDESVDLIVTSPPYFAQRSYQDNGEHYVGQIGSEDDSRAYVRELLACTAEWIRVLKPTGSLFVNLGDKYSQSSNQWGGSRRGHAGALAGTKADDAARFGVAAAAGAPRMGTPKSLMGLPWRYALGCIDELDLILRAEIVWDKPNGLPESVADRVRRSHEQWFHFVKQPRYYSAMDELREPYDAATAKRYAAGYNPRAIDDQRLTVNTKLGGDTYDENPLGKLPGSVWSIPTEPLKVPAVSPLDGRPLPDHFAAFPTEWPRRFLLGFSPSGICTACGEGRRPVTDREVVFDKARDQEHAAEIAARGAAHAVMSGGTARSTLNGQTTRTIVGYVCACNEPIGTPLGSSAGEDPTLTTGRAGLNRERAGDAGRRVITRHEQRHYAAQLKAHPHRAQLRAESGEAFDHWIRTDRTGARPIPPGLLEEWLADGTVTRPPAYVPAPTSPAVVLDPFGGTGTVALVADVLGRTGVSVDLSHDYGRLARWRTTDRGERARAMRVEKPPVQVKDQAALF